MNTIKFIFLYLLFCTLPLSFTYSQEQKITIIKPTETVNGHTFNFLMNELFRWILCNDNYDLPLADISGSGHENSQPRNDMVFLTGNLGAVSNRSMTMSKEKPIFLPVILGLKWIDKNDIFETDFKPAPGESDGDFLTKVMNKDVDGMVIHSFTINGEYVVNDFSDFRFVSDILDLNLSLNLDPDCDVDISNFVARGGGYVLALKLPAGQHVIQFEAESYGDDNCQDVTWNLKVE